jgi:hypothetical protein
MVACIVGLIIFFAMLVCGVFVNMYLYRRGLFRDRRTSTSRRVRDWDEEYFLMDVSGRHDVTGNYVRKGLVWVVAALLLVGVVMMTLLVPSWH